MWSVLQGGIKTNVRRQNCEMSEDNLCAICHTTAEGDIHILRDCPLVYPIWCSLLKEYNRSLGGGFFTSNFTEWINSHTTSSSILWNSIFGITIWSIWKARNEVIFANWVWKEEEVIKKVKFLVLEVDQHWKVGDYRLLPGEDWLTVWVPPPVGWLKFNVDAVVRLGGTQVGCGGVLHDEKGTWVRGFCRKLEPCSIMEAEMHVVLTSLEIAWEYGTKNLCIETNCRGVCCFQQRAHNAPSLVQVLSTRA
uniref:Ribonuclease H protein At1g65750 family n=1 Tax=Cajanus cajan TaxID=3821 RepID=A0A151SRT3_CAJCA|nr:Putative ribonuclease H protein At1g65750 family [Cajanus cajan]